jgi:probable HAF family extracellular repeat protein
MRRRGKIWGLIPVGIMLLGHMGGVDRALAASADQYEVTAIEPVSGWERSKAYGINNLSQVVGRFHNYDAANDLDIDRQAFIWDIAGGARLLPTLSGESGAWGINDNGLVSGFSFNAGGYQRAVRWNSADDTLVEIGTLENSATGVSGDSSTAFDLNNMGQVTGNSDIPNNANDFAPFHGFLYDDGSGIQDLGTLDATWPEYQFGYSIAYDVNDNQQVVGIAHNSAWEFRPFIYDPSNGMQELSRDLAYGSGEWYAVAINDDALIGGHVLVADGQCFPYYWATPSANPVSVTMPPAFPYGEIYGMNASGEMVGVMWDVSGLEHAFVFDTTNGLRDLNDLITSGSGWILHYARDINDAGQIVGFGEHDGAVRGFVLTPAASSDPGWISGTITDELTGMPLESIRVNIFDETGAWVTVAETDATGSYTSSLLPIGIYFAATDNDKGYINQLFDGVPCTSCDPTNGTTISVAGGSTTSVNFVLVNSWQSSATVYESAEHGTTAGWQVFDGNPTGAIIQNVYDSTRQSQVIELSGAGISNGYVLRTQDGSKWHNQTQFILEWSVAFSETFNVFIDVETTEGHKWMIYTPVDGNGLGSQTNIHHGLGSGVIDGNWHTFIRDLQADLEEAQPGVEILEVNGFFIRGSGRVDDIRLWRTIPAVVYENAEHGTTAGWQVFDTNPAGATIQNVYDDLRRSQVIELSGAGISNGYVLRNQDGSKWHNQTQLILEWSMAYTETFNVFIDVETTEGHRWMVYTPVDVDNLGAGSSVHHGVGSSVIDGNWHTFVRDLGADLQEAQPEAVLLEINGFFIRGSGRVDDIRLWSTMPVRVYENAENGTTVCWRVFDTTPAGATIQNTYDDTRQSRVIELSGSGTDNGYVLRDSDDSKWQNQELFVLEWSMAYSETFTVYVDVETTSGHRWMSYTPIDVDYLGALWNVHHGLGSAAADGTWRTFVRNLQADLQEAQPGVTVLEVNGLFIRGSGRVDDIRLRSN